MCSLYFKNTDFTVPVKETTSFKVYYQEKVCVKKKYVLYHVILSFLPDRSPLVPGASSNLRLHLDETHLARPFELVLDLHASNTT